MNTFNWLDYVILSILGLSALFSFVRGFAREAISLAAWILACILAVRFMAPVSTLFVGSIQTETLRFAAAFLSLFVAVLLLGAFLKLIFGRFIHAAELGGVDRLLGLVFGVVRGSVVVIIALFLLRIASIAPLEGFQDSRLLPHFDRVTIWMAQFLPASYFLLNDSSMASVPKDKQGNKERKQSARLSGKKVLREEEILKLQNMSDTAKLELLIGSILDKEPPQKNK